MVTILNDNEVELSELFRLRLRMEESFISNSIRLIPDTADVLIQDNDSELFLCSVVLREGLGMYVVLCILVSPWNSSAVC